MLHAMSARGLRDRFHVDSAGTGAWHVGKPPDPRACATALQRGFDISHLRARQLSREDGQRFDHIVAMDADNLSNIERILKAPHVAQVSRLLDFATGIPERDVPDPYYGGQEGFDRMFDLIAAGVDGFIEARAHDHSKKSK